MEIPKLSELGDDTKAWVILMEELREHQPEVVIEWVRKGLSFTKEEATDNLMACISGVGVAITAASGEELAHLKDMPHIQAAIRNLLGAVYEMAEIKDRKEGRAPKR